LIDGADRNHADYGLDMLIGRKQSPRPPDRREDLRVSIGYIYGKAVTRRSRGAAPGQQESAGGARRK
jgi:hypothetical protein